MAYLYFLYGLSNKYIMEISEYLLGSCPYNNHPLFLQCRVHWRNIRIFLVVHWFNWEKKAVEIPQMVGRLIPSPWSCSVNHSHLFFLSTWHHPLSPLRFLLLLPYCSYVSEFLYLSVTQNLASYSSSGKAVLHKLASVAAGILTYSCEIDSF